jgi:hypothetical protein
VFPEAARRTLLIETLLLPRKKFPKFT